MAELGGRELSLSESCETVGAEPGLAVALPGAKKGIRVCSELSVLLLSVLSRKQSLLVLSCHLQSSAVTSAPGQVEATGLNLGSQAQSNQKGTFYLLSQILY